MESMQRRCPLMYEEFMGACIHHQGSGSGHSMCPRGAHTALSRASRPPVNPRQRFDRLMDLLDASVHAQRLREAACEQVRSTDCVRLLASAKRRP
jgi:hypothetical protein